MLDNFNSIFPSLIFLAIQSLIISGMILKLISISSPDFLRFLYISSGKSTTNAKLLGGLSVSASLISCIASLLYFYPEKLSLSEKNTFFSALISILLVTFYGYIDDKFEVRVRFKLSLQLISILSFSWMNAHNIFPENQGTAFILSSILGLALINGTNLLDGLDTLSVKLGLSASAAFLYLGIISNSTATIFLSVVLISALTVFYFVNREPAKVYMGEIGGSIIGLVFYVQSSLCISELKTKMGLTQAIALVLIAGFLPICELGISFLRRIISKKSPFLGDRLHLHYIVKSKYRLSASQASSHMGLGTLAILSFGFIISDSYGSIIAFSLVLLFTLQSYLWVCLREWQSCLKPENVQNIFMLFEGKKINIVDSTPFNSLDISLNDTTKKVVRRKPTLTA